MAYPAIFPNEPLGYDFGLTAWPSGQPGFEYLGNLYVFITQQGTVTAFSEQKLHAFQSLDGGQTWAELDAANAPGGHGIIPGFSNSPGLGGPRYTVARDGSTALILSSELALFGSSPSYQAMAQVQLIRFDLTTSLWSTITTIVPGPVDFTYTGNVPFPNTAHPTAVFTQLVVRGAGDYILYYSGAPAVVGGLWYGRLYYATFDGTTFGSGVLLPDQNGAVTYWGTGAARDSAGIIHLFYITSEVAIATQVIYHVGLTSALGFGITQTLFTLPMVYPSNDIAAVTVSNPLVYTPTGGVETVAISTEVNGNDDWDFQNLTLYYGATALNPTWSESVVTTGVDPETIPSSSTLFPVPVSDGFTSQTVGLGFSNNLLMVAWAVTLLPDEFGAFYYATTAANALSWTAATLAYNTSTITGSGGFTLAYRVGVIPMSTGIGILGSSKADSRDLETLQFTLVGAAPPPPSEHEIVTARLFGPHSPSKMAMKATSVTANGITTIRLTPLNPTHSPIVPMMLFRNHLLLTEGLDYTRSGLWVTLLSGSEVIQTAPFIAVISMGGTAASTFDGSIIGAVNGSNTVFVLPGGSMQAMLFQNGKLLTETKEYQRFGNLVIFATAPAGGDVLTAQVYTESEPTQVTTFDRTLDYSQAARSIVFRNGLLMTQPADVLTTGDTAAFRPAQVPQSDDIVTLEAWTFDVSDPDNPPALGLPTQYSTDDGTITGARNNINNIFVIQTSNLVTDLLLAYNGLGMTQGIDYSWACVQNSSAGPWVTTITMMSGQNPADDGLLTAEVFSE